mgnify:CR=1 FL=1
MLRWWCKLGVDPTLVALHEAQGAQVEQHAANLQCKTKSERCRCVDMTQARCWSKPCCAASGAGNAGGATCRQPAPQDEVEMVMQAGC